MLLYFALETLGNIGGALRRRRAAGFVARLAGRVKALARILVPSLLETG